MWSVVYMSMIVLVVDVYVVYVTMEVFGDSI